MTIYTQIVARSERPTQVLAGLRHLDAYLLSIPGGHLVCERTSETIDVRISHQVAREISRSLGPGLAVLAIAADEGHGFWCALYDGGVPCCEHNRLTGAQAFGAKPAERAEVERLSQGFGRAVVEEVEAILNGAGFESARDRHAALAQALALPSWTPGVGYARIASGELPPAAGEAKRPPRSVGELRQAGAETGDTRPSDPLERFRERGLQAFAFLESELGMRREEHRFLRPGDPKQFLLSFRGRGATIVVEGLSYGARTRLSVIDSRGRLLSLTAWARRHHPDLLDLCRLADGQGEQLPLYADVLHRAAAAILAGELEAVSSGTSDPGFSLEAVDSPASVDEVVARCGPRGQPRTVWARIRWALHRRRMAAKLRRTLKLKARPQGSRSRPRRG